MILVDTSIWINYFNNTPPDIYTDKLDSALADGVVAMGDLIFLEILQGFRNDKDYRKAKQHLSSLPLYNLFNQDAIAKCADNYRALRKKGFTVRSTADVIIATFCIEHKIPLLFSDRDFEPFVEKLGLVSALSKT
ncbi:MAG: PIN domain nuclease [Candidatus Competibacteraceae bacterium]